MEGLLETGDKVEPVLAGEAGRVAIRLAELSFTFRAGILVSDALVQELPDPERFDLRPLGSMRLHPGGGRIAAYEVFATRDDATRRRISERHELWGDALRRHQMGEWGTAADLFREYLAALPHDRPARIFLRDCRRRMA